MNQLEDLAIAYRVLAEYGVIDGYGHVSVRSASNPQRYFISRSLAPELVTEADLMEFDLDSNPIDRRDREMYSERYIHGQIYQSRPEVTAVVHNHSPSVIPFGITPVKLRPVYHMSAFVGRGVPVYEIRDSERGTDMLVRSNYLGKALAQCLGSCGAALMRGHGAVVVAEGLPGVVGRSIYLEMNARLQMQALTLAKPEEIVYLDGAETEKAANMNDFLRAWGLWRAKGKRQLDAEKSRQA